LGLRLTKSTQELLALLKNLHPWEIDLSLQRIEGLLKALGNPHLKLPPCIHIAGTNGKGSTLAFCQSIFEAHGLRVHKYISPHLIRFNERIILNGQEISSEFLEEILKEVIRVNNSNPITFFEATTAAAFLAFSKIPADVLLLETGMGGEFDATNVIENPILTGITKISFDHMEFLGETLSSIAKAKAGIIKRNVPVVVARQELEALKVIQNKALTENSPCIVYGKEWDENLLPSNVNLGLEGDFQKMNAAMALKMVEETRLIKGDPSKILHGLRAVKWPGRLQKVENKMGIDLWVDGAHNEDACRSILPTLQNWAREKELITLFVAKETKNPQEMLKIMGSVSHKVYLPNFEEEGIKFHSPQSLENYCQSLNMSNYEISQNVNKLLIFLSKKTQCRVLCMGSLHFVGAILKEYS
jgi:dihydrofolate synthase/folylpolyglutamate synthase